ncbi:hypothetical protein AsGV129 [Agrotis segetum granulovirus]|uniref:Uncharacterized protein n=1 Tax=Agrotis segetum granulosis virus TaxID=10464 RepID=A0A023MI86_GVAS|nr:hypothetical protein AsGV129 [Agrotis segetum granulovirus]AHN92165.1 hypothetical protein AsGV126 [Agrotis segetum granulovirus]AKN63403.1 hypothetical protein AsGV129 [Agrotis segetum granulovirus]
MLIIIPSITCDVPVVAKKFEDEVYIACEEICNCLGIKNNLSNMLQLRSAKDLTGVRLFGTDKKFVGESKLNNYVKSYYPLKQPLLQSFLLNVHNNCRTLLGENRNTSLQTLVSLTKQIHDDVTVLKKYITVDPNSL